MRDEDSHDEVMIAFYTGETLKQNIVSDCGVFLGFCTNIHFCDLWF